MTKPHDCLSLNARTLLSIIAREVDSVAPLRNPDRLASAYFVRMQWNGSASERTAALDELVAARRVRLLPPDRYQLVPFPESTIKSYYGEPGDGLGEFKLADGTLSTERRRCFERIGARMAQEGGVAPAPVVPPASADAILAKLMPYVSADDAHLSPLQLARMILDRATDDLTE